MRSGNLAEQQAVALPTLLGDAINGLGPEARSVARHVAAFDDRVRYSSLVKALVGAGKEFASDSELDVALSRLQNLGLMTWNQNENTYALHPVVRGAILRAGLPLSLEA